MANLYEKEIPLITSYKNKIKRGFERQKEIMDIYDKWNGFYRDTDELEKIDVNYGLMNARLDVKLYDEPICVEIEKGKPITIDDTPITHFPIMHQVTNTMIGEVIARPFKPSAKDIGTTAQTLRTKKFNELLKEVIQSQILNPIKDQITQSYISEIQANNMNLNEEQLAQIQNDINNRVKDQTPESVIDFMVNDFRTPVQKQAQQLLNTLVAKLDIKTIQVEGFKHALPTGREVYYVGDRHNEPVFELCNPKYVTWGGSQNTEWIQDADWCKYEQWLTPIAAIQKHAEHLSKKSQKELETLIEPIGGFKGGIGDPLYDDVQRNLMLDLSEENSRLGQKYKDLNYKTREGQKSMLSLYADIISKYGNTYGSNYSNYGIREAHICWRDKRIMKFVTKLENGKKNTYWFDEHYEEQAEDISILKIYIDEIWEGTILGTGSESIYLNIRPIPNQYPSKYNPFGTKLPYIGRNYYTFMNNTKNIAPIDPAKPWQRDYDVVMSQIKFLMKTDMGNQFLMYLELKPEGWSYKQWLTTAKNTKFLMTNLKKHGSPVDPSLLRNLNLSNVQEIASKIELLNYYRSNLIQSLSFNDSRMGSIGQYSTNQNIQQSQSASYNQTEGLFETHRLIVEKALNAFMNRARYIYRDNIKRFLALDDVARTELEMNPDIWYEEQLVEFTTSSDELRKVEMLKANLLPFIQNQMSFDGTLSLVLSDTTSDVIDIMKKESKRAEDQRTQNIQIEQERFNQQLAAQQQEKEADRQSTIQLELAKLESQERRTVIDLDKFRIQNDVDRNNTSDLIQKAIIETESKERIESAKLNQDKIKHDNEMTMRAKELIKKQLEKNKKGR